MSIWQGILGVLVGLAIVAAVSILAAFRRPDVREVDGVGMARYLRELKKRGKP